MVFWAAALKSFPKPRSPAAWVGFSDKDRTTSLPVETISVPSTNSSLNPSHLAGLSNKNRQIDVPTVFSLPTVQPLKNSPVSATTSTFVQLRLNC
jgi:hypothetical protein